MESKEPMLEKEPSMSDLSIEANLKEKLNQLTQYSSEIEALKKQKSDLDSFYKSKESVEETSTENMLSFNKQIKEKKEKIKELHNSIAILLLKSTNPYFYVGKLDRALAREISDIVNRNEKLKELVKSALLKEIVKLYELKEENITLEIKQKGSQDGFIINDNATGLKLFIKLSKIFDDKKSVDPRELFAYKVLEYMQLGPETRFLIPAISSSSIGARIHIITKDVAYSDNPNIIKIFFTDNFITEENPNSEALTHWQASLEDKEFRTKFITISIVNDLLHLNDSLATNAWNYGSILQKSKTNETQHKGNAAIVDFEIRETLFKYEPEKNPVISLIEKLGKNDIIYNKFRGELISYKVIREGGYFKDAESELSEAIEYVNKNFSQVIIKAEEEINNIIYEFDYCFLILRE